MEKIIHTAASRGHANHGWLDTYHTFSFAGYHDPQRMHFGELRVLNDDTVAGGKGFGAHPHENMEIVSIPLYGALEHNDNTGRHAVIKANEVQIMSAGTGIVHSEKNASSTEPVNFLQIWIFPKEENIAPRYEQKLFDPGQRKNQLQLVVSPEKNNGAIWINQDAWFSLGNLDAGKEINYNLNSSYSGIYLFVINGSLQVADETLQRRDGIGLSDINNVAIKAAADADFLLMEMPVN